MNAISGLRDDEAERIRIQFGVAQEQVIRDHIVSVILSVLTERDALVFFGGTALARTHLPDARLSEDIDLLATADRRGTADQIVTRINRVLLPRYGRVSWSADLAEVRDVTPVTVTTDEGVAIRIQLLRSGEYPSWPTEIRSIKQRYSDVPPTRLRVPTSDAFVAWKTDAWFSRAAPRDLFDLWSLANRQMITPEAAELFARFGSTGATPSPNMFQVPPPETDWHTQLAAQTRLEVTGESALAVVRDAWAGLGTLGSHV